jgi:hypothetical protein
MSWSFWDLRFYSELHYNFVLRFTLKNKQINKCDYITRPASLYPDISMKKDAPLALSLPSPVLLVAVPLEPGHT